MDRPHKSKLVCRWIFLNRYAERVSCRRGMRYLVDAAGNYVNTLEDVAHMSINRRDPLGALLG